MKRLLPFLLSPLLWGQNYTEVISLIDRTYAVEGIQQIEAAAYEGYRAALARQLPSLDASLSRVKLEETPTMTLGGGKLPMGTRNKASGELTLTYPIFTGFALSGSIEKAKLSYEKSQLQVSDLKRNLYLNATRLYSAAAASDAIIAAAEEAKAAMAESYKKALGLHRNGLIAPSELYAIEAKTYEIEAQLTEAKSRKQQLLIDLGYLCGTPIIAASLPAGTPAEPERGEIIAAALSGREDLLSLYKMLGIAGSDVTLAQSRMYPQLSAIAALKRQGDTLSLNGDGYTNADQSYAGVAASWNLYSGGGDLHAIEAANAAKLAAQAAVEDYKQRVSAEIENAFLERGSLQSKYESARMQVKAAQEYAALTRGRFDNQLAGADELGRSIADLSAAKAKAAMLESELFSQNTALWLYAGLDPYRQRVLLLQKP